MTKEGAKAFFKRFVFVFLVVFLILVVLLSISSFILGNFGVNLGLEGVKSWSGVFDKVRVAFAPGDLVAGFDVSRTSCVAPCNIFFDALYGASVTTDVNTARPFHDLDFSWDFGDPSSGVWTLTDNKSKNIAKGGVAAHVFENPGVYSVSLNVKDSAGNTASKQVSVTITDPNVAFTEANTFCFAKDNLNWAGCPTTITANRIVSNDASLVNDLNSRFAANRRLVLRRGDSWTINSVIHIDAVGPGILGAFGLGNKPKLVSSVMSDPNYVGLVNINGDDWRVMDLFLFGPSYSPDANGLAAISISAAQSNDLVLRNDITKFSFVGIANDWSFDSDDLAWVENHIYDIGQGGAYIGGNRIALIGNWIQNISLSHVMRVWYIDKGVIEHNILHDPSVVSGGARHALKLHSDRCLITSGPNCISTVPSQRVVVSDNDFRGSGWVVAIGPQDGGTPGENVWEIVFERNILRPDIGDANLTGVLLSIAAPDITVRNNIFIAAGTKYLGSGTGGAVHIWQDGPSPQPDRVNVYNNVLYKGDNGLELVFADVNSGANIQIRNNLAVLTNAYLGGEHQFLFNNVPVTASNNLFYSPNSPASCLNPSGGSTCLNPLFVNAGTENFRLQSGSPAINTGFATSTVFDDYDGNSRPVGAYDLGAFEFGSSPPASAINAQINASRLSCVAPCAVFFDATATNASTTSRPFHELDYSWDFGDSGAGVWPTDGLSKNTAKGGVAAHVFENPGTYTVSLNVKDNMSNSDSKQTTITVNAFGGVTYYVSSTGSDGNAGTLTTAPLRTFDFAMTKVATNTRILFKRGESFSTSSQAVSLFASGPGIIGAYYYANGSDDRTIAKPSITQTNVYGVFVFTSSGPGWKIMDLALHGPGSSSTNAGILGGGNSIQSQSLVLRVDIDNFLVGYSTGVSESRHYENFIVDSNIHDFNTGGGYGMFFAGDRSGILGTTSRSAGQHVVRYWHFEGAVIEHNNLQDAGPTQHVLKLHSVTYGNPVMSEYAVVSDNYFASSSGDLVVIAPQNDLEAERLRNIVVERNTFQSKTDSFSSNRYLLVIKTEQVTVRNNVFIGTGGAIGFYPVSIQQAGAGLLPDKILVYDNTVYKADDPGAGGEFHNDVGSAINVIFRNNLAVLSTWSSGSPTQMVQGSATASNNVLYTPAVTSKCLNAAGATGSGACVNPLFVNPASGDFHLQPNSPMIDAGFATSTVFDDYDLNPRPQGTGWDIGAFENGTVVAPPSAINISLSANRLSCVAPCSVFFDASGTTDLSVTSKPFHDLDYTWNFGDFGAGNWAMTGKSKNIGKGPMGSHVFDNGGIYTVTLSVKDVSGNTASQQITINVQDANSTYNGANTRCLSTSGNFAGCPSGATTFSGMDLNSQITWLNGASGRRLLLRAGESWSAADIALWADGGTFGAYGAGKAHVNSNISINAQDWRLMDLDVFPTVFSNSRFALVYRVSIIDGGYGPGPNLASSYMTKWGDPISNNNFLVDSLCYRNANQFGIYYGGENTSIMGTNCSSGSQSAPGSQHTLRTYYINKMILSNNYFGEPGQLAGAHVLKLHSAWNIIPPITDTSRKLIVSDNIIQGGGPSNGEIIVIQPQNDQSDERAVDVIVERNYFRTSDEISVALWVSAQNATIRNNVFEDRATYAYGHYQILVGARAIEPSPRDVYVYGNTGYTNRPFDPQNPIDSYNFIDIRGGVTNAIVKNNIASAPNDGGAVMVKDQGIGTVQSNNLLTNTPGFVSASPSNIAGFRLLSSSVAKDSGTSIPTLFDDYEMTSRPQGSAYDLGAFEFTLGGSDVNPPTAPSALMAISVGISQIDLSWSASSDDIGVAGYRVWRNNAVVATTGGTSYTDTGLLSGTLYKYNITAFDFSGKNSTSSNSITPTTLVDTTPPGIVSVTALTNTSVQVIFNEMVNRTSAQILGNYAINGSILVNSAVLNVDNVTLTLGTTQHSSANYRLTVTNVKDIAGNAMALTQRTYQWIMTANAMFNGTLRFSSINSRYFTDDSGKAIYLTGSHTWANFVDNGLSDPPAQFNWTDYLDMLDDNNHNLIRLWVGWEQSKWMTWTSLPYWFAQSPFQRTGPGNASDGKPKFNVTLFNQTYFDRLRERTIEAGDRGIYVAIMLFDGWSLESKGLDGNPWVGHYFNANNNINGINGDPNGDSKGIESHTLSIPAITAIQEAYIRKVVDTVNDLDNVLYEVTNEDSGGGANTLWQYHVINYVKSYEVNKSKQHPIGMSMQYPFEDDNNLFNSPADWISPNAATTLDVSGSKVIMSDTDHGYGAVQGDRAWLWERFTRGFNMQFMDTYGSTDYATVAHPNLDPDDPVTINVRENMGYANTYAKKMNLLIMTPQGNLCSTSYCLASGTEYLVYLPSGGSATVNLAATSGNLSVEWLNPSNGQKTNSGSVSGGASRVVSAPFSGDAVVYLKKSEADIALPSVSITSPLNASVVSGSINIAVTASDDQGIAFINFFVDGSLIGQDTNLPYNFLWSSQSVQNGTHLIRAQATDIFGNSSNSIISVNVQNSPINTSNNLVAHWKFDEGSGTTASDSSGNSNTGTLNGPTWTTGKLAGGLSFDGVNGRIDVANSASLDISGQSISISMWINPQALASGDSVLIAKFWDPTKNPALPYQYGVELTAGNRPTFYFGNGVTFNRADMTPTIPYGQWSYITVTYDGGNVRWYRDGIAVSVTPLVSSLQARGQAMKMGVDQDNTQPNKGVIDELRIYNKVLSQGEITALFNLGSGQVCGDNICSAGEDCSADAILGCTGSDTSCFEPTCTNGCGQVAVSNGGTDESCVAPSSCNGAGVCVGTFTLNTSVIVGAGGAPGEVSLLGATNKSVVFNFSVNGNVGNLNDATADAKFFKNGVNRTNSTCILAETGANKRVYECTIKMPFYDEAGVWNISVNISDDAGLTKTDNSGTFSVNILRDVTPSAFAVNFPIIVPGAVDVPANAMPLNLTNTGNFNDTISIQAYNLHGVSTPSQFIDASNFRAGLTASVCSTGVFLANNTVTLVPLSNLPVGANSKEGFYYCLKIVPSISSQLYSTLPGFGWKIGFF